MVEGRTLGEPWPEWKVKLHEKRPYGPLTTIDDGQETVTPLPVRPLIDDPHESSG